MDVSSLRTRRADWMAKPVARSAMIRKEVAKYRSVRLPPPAPASNSARALFWPMKVSTVGPIQPYAMPMTRTPAPHPSSAPRCSRKARPRGCPRLGAAAGRAWPRRYEPCAEVAPAGQGGGRGDQEHRRRDQQQQGPPALIGKRPRLLGHSDRGEPGDCSVADVADGAQHVRRPEHRPGHAIDDTGVLGDLRHE